MIRLNLLPPDQKKKLELAELSRLVTSLAVWVLFFLIIFLLLLISTFFCLSILLKEQGKLIEIRESNPQIQYLLEIERKIAQTNEVVNEVYSKQQEMILWTPLLEEMSKITPSGIYLTNLSYQADDKQIILRGWANERENLLGFQKSLEESPFFEEVEAPLANLVKKTDIDFSFALNLK